MHRKILKPGFVLMALGAALLAPPASRAQSLTLFAGGKTDYVIVVPQNASTNCQTAVAELRSYLQRITGADVRTTQTKPARHAIIFEENKSSDAAFDVNQLNNDGFRMKTAGDNLVFTAKTGQGLLNAVYTFLDDQLGCRYFATNCIIIPKKTDITLPALDDVENPALIYRTTPFANARDPGYVAWHKLTPTASGGGARPGWGLFVHTMYRFVSPDEFFATHPEYFAERGGVRITNQLCLSNPDVLRITVERIKQMMATNDAKFWSVSQLDNEQYCECEKCKALDTAEGSPSASVINFVNQVASNFPDRIISTLAYQYSRKAPAHLKPATNVNIMLCSIEANRAKPIEADTGRNNFATDIAAWSKISDDLMIWDYVVNFNHLVSPFPNFHVLKPNINLFINNHAKMMYEQGHMAAGSEFNELRCYLVTKLMWNPKSDVDKMMDEFLAGFYGKAGPIIRQYIDLETKNLVDSGKTLGLYQAPATHAGDYLSPTNLHAYFVLFDQAMDAVKGDPTLSNRVEVARQSLRYASLEVDKYQVFKPDWVFGTNAAGKLALKPGSRDMLETFYRISQQFGDQWLNEHRYFMSAYYKSMNDYFNYAVVDHLAVGKKITFERPYQAKFNAGGPNGLIDGVRAGTDPEILWQGWGNGGNVDATIDLLSVQTVSTVEITTLDDSSSHIMAAKGATVQVSEDGEHYTPAASYENPRAGEKMDRQVIRLPMPFKEPVKARYLKVHVQNLGRLPLWRGLPNAPAFLFLDEIVVK